MDEIIDAARRARATAPAVRRLAARLENPAEIPALIDRALATADPETAVRLMLAAALAGSSPTADQVGRVLPVMDRVDRMPVLVGCATGDRPAMLLDLVELGRLSTERDALALLLAAELMGDAPPPPRLLVHLRLVGRRVLDFASRTLVGLAARDIDDPGVREVLADCIAAAETPAGQVMADEMSRLLRGPVDAVLPASAAPKVVSGFTARRAVERVGRNEPCPCGSGKKYKKCCWRKDEERRLDPSPVAGLTMAEYRARAGEHMTSMEFARLRPHEMAALDPDTLPTAHLMRAVRKLASFRLWSEAERFMEALGARDDAVDDADEWREELIEAALDAGRVDIARRQAALLAQPEELRTYISLALKLAEDEAGKLAAVERAALEAAQGDADVCIELAFALLTFSPALGLLVARSALDPERSLDSEMLLENIEESRDRLQLPPGDPASDWYEVLADRHYADLVESARATALSAENERLVAEVEDLRKRLGGSAAKSNALEQSLRAATRRMADLARRGEATGTAEAAAAHSPLPTDAGPDAATLRQEISTLKGLISEGNEERAALRKQLADLGRRVRDTTPAPERRSVRAEPDPNALDDLEVEVEASARGAVLVPTFSARAEDELRAAPQTLARSALRVVAELAAGNESRWSGVKALRTVAGLYSARVGLHHRLLFELDHDERRLEVRELVARRDLERALARY